MANVRDYYNLTKPGIIYGNALTTLGGFLLATKFHFPLALLFATLGGISLVIASACVFNNYIDRDIDEKMARTKKRALVSGEIAGQSALIYASVLGIVGYLILVHYVNRLTAGIGLVAFVDYVVLYGYAKRNSVHGTVVGSISGAAPVVAGYTAVTDHFGLAALILFLILVCWQMPHFYAIAMYRIDDYKAAHIPVLPIKSGMRATKIQILAYIITFMLALGALTTFGYAGVSFLIVMETFAFYWLWLGLKGFKTPDNKKWARKMFFFSLVVILALSVMLSLGKALP